MANQATVCQASANAANTSTANTTQFWTLHGNVIPYATETSAQIIYRTAGTFSNLQVYVSANTVAATSTFTLRKNAADVTQTLSIGSSATGKFEDSTHTDAVIAGDKFDLKTVPGATTNTYTISIISLLFVSSTAGELVTRMSVGSPAVLFNTISVTRYMELSGDTNNGIGTETNIQCTQKKAGTFKHLAVNFSANTSTQAGTWTMRKNTANATVTVSITASTSGFFEDTTHSDTVVAGDLYNHSFVIGTNANFTFETAQISFVDTSNGINYLLAGHSAGATTGLSVTWFNPIAGTSLSTQTTEAQTQTKINVTSATFLQMSIFVQANTITAASTLTFRKNTANGNQTASITASTTGVFTDTTNTDATVIGDLVNTQLVTGGTGTSLNTRYVALWTSGAVPTTVWIEWEEI